MPEGEKRVILSSDLETKPSREKRSEQEAKEKQKEKLKTRECLDKAVLELKNVLEGLPKNSKEAKRAEHTLKAVEWALGNLGKEGAPQGKYRLAMKDWEGKPAKWPDGKPAVQDEGVPVDELIDLLKGKAKELNTEARNKQNVLKKKKEMDELWERYRSAHNVDLKDQTHDKAWVYSQWEKAKKAHEVAQEAYDLGYTAKGKELEGLADELTKRSETHFQAHYGHELPLSKEESDKQNVRTTHEAYLVHRDYRKTGNNDTDYKSGMDAMGKRRELKMEDEKEEEVKPVIQPEPKKEPEPTPEPEKAPEPPKPEPQPEPIKPTPEPGPKKPESGPKPEPAPIKVPERIAIVNAEAQVELMARKRANERLTEMFNSAGRLKKMWFRAWEEGYRQQLIDEERKKILGEANNPNWLKRTLFGAKKVEATGKKDLFAGKAEMKGESKKELGALAERFSKGYIKESEGEQKQQLEDKEFNQQINDLVFKYVEGGVSDEEFEQQKDALVTSIAKKYPDSFAAGKLTADNFLEAAKEFKKIHEHSRALARVDINLSVDLGRAKQAIKTEANIKWVDKMVAKMQKYPVLGHVFTPGAVGFGVSVGGYLFKKPLYWLGGAAGMGGLLGGMRRNFEQKRDLEMHRIERAMGNEIGDYESKNGQRKEMEKFVYEMKKASEVSAQLEGLRTAFDSNPSPENAAALTKLLAETEARMSLSEQRQKDLISFDGESSLERGRLYLMKELAEAKVKLNEKGFASNIASSQDYKDTMATLESSMDKLDKSERKKRWTENGKAVVVGAATGLVFGALAQQGAAEIGDRVSWLSWMRPGGKATGGERLYHLIKGDLPTTPSGAGLMEKVGVAGVHGRVKIDGSTDLIPNRSTGMWSLVDKTDHSKVLAEVDIDPTTGQLTPKPGTYDSNLLEFSSKTTGGGHRTIGEWVDSVKGRLPAGAKLEQMEHVGFYDNDTVSPKFDFNELKYYMHADAHGNITMDASKIQDYLEDSLGAQASGSKHGEKALDMLEAFKRGEIKIAIAPNPDHPSQLITFEVDPATHQMVSPAGSEVNKLFNIDSTGNVSPKSDVVIGMVENPQGTKDVMWINSIRGNEGEVDTGVSKEIQNQVTRKEYKDWWMPVIGYYPRQALEQKKKATEKRGIEKVKKGDQGGDLIKERAKDGYVVSKGGKKLFYISDEDVFKGNWHYTDYSDYEEEQKHKKDFEKKRIILKKGEKKVGVVTRGQKVAGDKADSSPGYPAVFDFEDEGVIAKNIVAGNVKIRKKDAEAMKDLDEATQAKYIEEQILLERKKYGDLEQNKEIVGYIESALKAADAAFAEYDDKENPRRNPVPDKSKIHLLGLYDFMGQSKLYGEKGMGAGGVCHVHTGSGEIFINMYALEGRTPEQKIEMIKHFVTHEAIHGSSANNYWGVEEADDSTAEKPKYKNYLWRRGGLVQGKLENLSTGLTYKERGRALTEAMTEELTLRALEKIDGLDKKLVQKGIYGSERDVLQALMKKCNVKFDLFAKASIDRRGLPKLVQAVEGRTVKQSETGDKKTEVSVARPRYMALVMAVMDHEYWREQRGYEKTKALIEGRPVSLSQEMLATMPAGMTEKDRDGNLLIKNEILEKYPNIQIPVVRRKAA